MTCSDCIYPCSFGTNSHVDISSYLIHLRLQILHGLAQNRSCPVRATRSSRSGRRQHSNTSVGRDMDVTWTRPYPDTPWDCHICRSVGVVLGVNVGIYGIHGVSGYDMYGIYSFDMCRSFAFWGGFGGQCRYAKIHGESYPP